MLISLALALPGTFGVGQPAASRKDIGLLCPTNSILLVLVVVQKKAPLDTGP